MSFTMKTQSGAAAIWFVFVAFAILGMGALGVEGSRYITEKAHLGDAMEATAVAVSESDNVRGTSSKDKFDENKAKSIATAWVNYLVPDNKASTFNVSREKREEIIVPGGKVKRTVYRYKIDSSITQKSWMQMKGVPSFGETQTVYNKATAARIRTDFEPVDVVFVSDFSGSMKGKRIRKLKEAIDSVTTTIYRATKELQEKHKGETVNNSSFGFVPFSKRIVVKKGQDYYCASMLKPPKGSQYERPMLEQRFSQLGNMWNYQLKQWFDENKYSYSERLAMNKYLSYANRGGHRNYQPLDCNYGDGSYDWGRWKTCTSDYYDHISYSRSAKELQMSKDYVLSTPMKIGHSHFSPNGYCQYRRGKPNFYNIDREELASEQSVKEFNRKISTMKEGGGTDMYHGLLAAPGQFDGAINKNRFIFVLSDGDENTVSFKKLVENGLCRNMREKLSVNANGETVKFEMFVIGLEFNNKKDWAYRTCFGKHIYEVRDLDKLKDVIMELLSNTTSYNVER